MSGPKKQSEPVERRLDELVEQYGLDARAHAALRVLIEVFATDEHAATTVRAPEETVDRHVADGLTGLEVAAIREASRMTDIGTGAGIPALVLAAALPDCEVVAMDTVGRKVGWVLACGERMGLTNLRGVHARAEAWPEGIGAFDVVTARAVAQLGVLVEYAAPLLREGGALVAWKGVLEDEESRVASSVAEQLKMSPLEILPMKPWADARARCLVVSEKQGPTPERFPRRPGLALKRPLT